MLLRICSMVVWLHTISALPTWYPSLNTRNIYASAQSQLTKRAVTCPAKGVRQFMPLMRTINDTTTNPNIFHVTNDTATGANILQVMTFTEVPPTATNLNLFWSQSLPPRDFTATGGGTVNVYVVDSTKLPAENETLTVDVVEVAIEKNVGPFGTGRIGSGAFGGWPAVLTQQDHLVGSVNATVTPEITFCLTLQENGDVRLVQNAENGWYLFYDC